ncbi:MAG: membrane-like protein, partial [Polynucleobacter sp. 24-46-87]
KQATLNVDIDQARYKNVVLSEVKSQIPNLSAKNLTLNIHGVVSGEGSEMMEYIAASPAGVQNPNLVKKLFVNGPLTVDLGLSIPLSGDVETKVDAKLDLPGNTVKWGDIPPFENLKGKVRITETNPEFEDITANFLGGAFNVSSANSTSENRNFKVSGDISAQFIKSYVGKNLHSKVNPALLNAMSGSANYSGLINFNQDGSQTNLKIDLRNWASSAPTPAQKELGTPMTGQFNFKTYSSKKSNSVLADWSVNFGEQYFIQGNVGANNLVRNALGIGAPAPMPEQGYAVHLVNNEINLDTWLDFLSTVKDNKKTPNTDGAAPAEESLQISAQIKKLIALDREWNDFNFSSTEKNNVWQLRLNAPQLSGQMQWQPSSSEHPSGLISGKLVRLKIPDQRVGADGVSKENITGKSEQVEKLGAQRNLLNPNQIPSLNISIDDVSWTKANLGAVKIKSKTTQDLLKVESIHITNAQGDSRITGQWSGKTAGSPEQSKINLEMSIKDAGKIVSRWGNPKSLEGGSGKLSAKLAWSSPLFFPAFNTLSGTASLDLAQGRLLEVNSEGAKLLDVLSLQSLFRFATLDLKGSLGNLATQGTAFTSISSEFEVAQGIAQAKQFTMILDQARVAMSGQINIPQETQDLRITIFPTIDATGGSLAAFIINPIVGLGAVVGQYLITNQINRTMQSDYLVQGSWDKPEVIPLDQKGQPLDANTINNIRTKNLLKEQSKPNLPNAQPSNSNSTLTPNTPSN